MSYTISASFVRASDASRAIRLLRLAGVSAQELETGHEGAPFSLAPYGAMRPVAQILPGQHALEMVQPTAAAAPVYLTAAADPAQLTKSREIIFRCGGILLTQ